MISKLFAFLTHRTCEGTRCTAHFYYHMSSPLATSTESLRSSSLNTQALRGLAILSIITHNFTHWMHGAIFENEFIFQSWHVDKLLHYLSHPDYRLPLQLFSFFGHYGVVLFVFLSAYGLEKKYGHTSKEVPTLPFIWKHYLKLFSMCIVGYAGYLLLNAKYTDYPISAASGILSQLSMLSNLSTHTLETYAPTPYWYFGLMFELYIVYKLLLFQRSWKIIIGAILLSIIAQAVVIPNGDAMAWLRNNFIGSILPFGLGLLYARYEEKIQLSKTIYIAIAVLSLVAIFVTSISFIPWLFTPIFVCALGISVAQLLPQKIQSPIMWVGGISAAIFVSHPIVRQLCFEAGKQFDLPPYLNVSLFLIGALLVGWLSHPIIQRSNRLFMKLTKH